MALSIIPTSLEIHTHFIMSTEIVLPVEKYTTCSYQNKIIGYVHSDPIRGLFDISTCQHVIFSNGSCSKLCLGVFLFVFVLFVWFFFVFVLFFVLFSIGFFFVLFFCFCFCFVFWHFLVLWCKYRLIWRFFVWKLWIPIQNIIVPNFFCFFFFFFFFFFFCLFVCFLIPRGLYLSKGCNNESDITRTYAWVSITLFFTHTHYAFTFGWLNLFWIHVTCKSSQLFSWHIGYRMNESVRLYDGTAANQPTKKELIIHNPSDSTDNIHLNTINQT